MSKQPHTSFNLFFLVPFIVWALAGYGMTDPRYLQRYFSLINTHYNTFLDNLMYYATWLGDGIVITVILALLLIIPSLRNWWYFTAALLCNALPNLLMQGIKHYVNAPRPLKYFGDPAWIHMSPDWPRLMGQSFPSGHTTGAFSMFCFLSMLLMPKYKSLGFVFFLLAMLVAYSRIYLAAHFLEDVYWGSIIGSVGCLVIFSAMIYFKQNFFKNNSTYNRHV